MYFPYSHGIEIYNRVTVCGGKWSQNDVKCSIDNLLCEDECLYLSKVCTCPWQIMFQGCKRAEKLGCMNLVNVEAIIECEDVCSVHNNWWGTAMHYGTACCSAYWDSRCILVWQISCEALVSLPGDIDISSEPGGVSSPAVCFSQSVVHSASSLLDLTDWLWVGKCVFRANSVSTLEDISTWGLLQVSVVYSPGWPLWQCRESSWQGWLFFWLVREALTFPVGKLWLSLCSFVYMVIHCFPS